MVWPFSSSSSTNLKIFTDAAKRVFDEVSNGSTHAANVYRKEPKRKRQDWELIKQDLARIAGHSNPSAVTKSFRTELATQLEYLVSAHHYMNLPDDDRKLFATEIVHSTKQEQDRGYYYAFAYHYVWCEILQYIIFNGWDGDDHALQAIKDVCDVFREECTDHCKLVLAIARARSKGEQLPDAEKEAGRTVVLLKEAARRGVAGEKLDE